MRTTRSLFLVALAASLTLFAPRTVTAQTTGLENSYVVDGPNTTSVLNGGQGKQLNIEFVQEIEVRTGATRRSSGGRWRRASTS